MNSKPDNKCERRDDIILLIEIITNSRNWQEYQKNVKHFFLLFLDNTPPVRIVPVFFEVY